MGTDILRRPGHFPSSNRQGKCEETSSGGYLAGIDRISVSFDVADATRFEARTWSATVGDGPDAVGRRSSGRTVAEVGRHEGASVFLGLAEVAGRLIAKVEANPSRWADPGGCSLLPVDQVENVPHALLLMAERAGIVPGIDSLEEVRVKRVDVARDLRGVTVPSVMLRALLGVRRTYARNSVLWSDPRKNGAETLSVGSGAGLVRLYDQHAAYPGKGAEPGSLRFEVQARKGWLDSAGIRTAEDLTARRLDDLARNRWEWARMGETVTGTANVVAAVEGKVRAGEWSPTMADRLLGQLLRESLGIPRPTNGHTSSKYEAMKRELGLTTAEDLGSVLPDATVRARLDYESGYEVAA